jgi:hypothetical protein
LQNLTQEAFAAGFQVSEDNPLVGVAGRHQLLVRLGHVLKEQENIFNVTASGDAQASETSQYETYLCILTPRLLRVHIHKW